MKTASNCTISYETPDIETSSEGYAQRFSGAVGEYLLKVQENAMRNLLKTIRAKTVLDVGGGHGQFTHMLLEEGYQVTVLGSSDECGNRLKNYVETKKIIFCTGNLLKLPFPNRSFDIVLAFRLLCHLQHWEQCAAELCRIAIKNVFVDYPAQRSFNYLIPFLFSAKKRYEKNTRTFRSFQEQELLSVFKQNNFILSSQYRQFFFPMVLHRMIKQPAISRFFESITRNVGLNRLFGSPVIIKLERING